SLLGGAFDNAYAFTVTGGGNWWGDARGPRRSSSPAATGDSVSGPWGAGTLRTTPVFAGSVATGLRIVRGNNQTASLHPGSLPLALTARVIDDQGRPVAGVSVT